MDNIITLILICGGLSLVLNVLLKKLQVESVIGYIITGMVVGYGFDLEHNANLGMIAEFGIVFLMFTIGLEFSPQKLRSMKKEVFVYGPLQLGVTAAVFFAIGHWGFGAEPAINLIVSLALALSSTAIVLNLLTKNRQTGHSYGRNSVGVLLFQDIAVIPVLLMVSILASSHDSVSQLLLDVVIDGAIIFALLFVVARFVTPFVMEQVIGSRSSELFVGAILVFVIGSAQLAHTMGFSFSLGAFLAGMVIAETHYKHQVEADLTPFRDLLLGLCFITVAMQVNPLFVASNLFSIVAVMIALLVIKALILFGLMRLFNGARASLKTALILSQCGEFAFVVFETAQANNLFMDGDQGQILVMAIVFTMMLTPFLYRYLDPITDSIIKTPDDDGTANDGQEQQVEEQQVVICGFGKLGRRVGELLEHQQIPYCGIEHNTAAFMDAQSKELPVLFGNASRRQFLEGVKIDQARAIIIAMTNEQRISLVAHSIKQAAPHIPVIVSSSNDRLIEELTGIGVSLAIDSHEQNALSLIDQLPLTGNTEARSRDESL